jgi:putative heme degradation protein
MTEYSEGQKVKEQIYNEDYELVYTLTSEYVDGIRKSIKVFDTEGNQIKEIKG